MQIKSVSIQGFASYEKLAQSDDFQLDPACNLILGKNGCGKSNFLQAISFVLSDSFKSLSKQEKRALLHEGASVASRQHAGADVHTYYVEVILDNSSRRIPLESDLLKVRKTYNTQTDREDFQLNGKSIREKELHNIFESGGYSFRAQSQFQVIKQGQVQDLVQRGESSFLEMLKEVTGTRIFDEKLQKMETTLADAEVKKQALGQILREIESKLESLQQDKEAFKEIEELELRKKALQKMLYLSKIKAQSANLEQLRRQKNSLMAEREILLEKHDKQQAANSDQTSKAQQIQSELTHLSQKLEKLFVLKQELQCSKIEAQSMVEQQMLQEDMQRNFEEQYGMQLTHINNGINQLKKHADSVDNEIRLVQKEADLLLNEQKKLAAEKDLLLMRKHLQEEIQNNPAKRKKFFDEEISKIKLQVQYQEKEISDCTKNKEIVKKNIMEIQKQRDTIQIQIQEAAQEIASAQMQMQEAGNVKREVATQIKDRLFKRNEVELKATAVKTRLDYSYIALDKLEPIYCTLRRIEAVVKERQIKGYQGLLIDFVECKHPQFFSIIDIAAQNKLFSIIVDDLETAQQILQINREIKGGVVSIYTFETLSQVPQKQISKPYPANVKPLIDFVSCKDPQLSKLVQNLFYKMVLTKDYESAIEVAKNNNLDCVTPQLQIVNSGAFITRVGSNQSQSQDTRLGLYAPILKLKEQYAQALSEKQTISQQQDSLANSDLDALRQLQKCEIRLTRIKEDLSSLKLSDFELKKQLDSREAKLLQLDELISIHKAQIEAFKEQDRQLQKEQSFSKTDYSEKDSTQLVALNKQINILGLQARDKLQRVETLKAQKNQQILTLKDNFMRNQNHLDEQKQTMGIGVTLTKAQAGIDFEQVKQQLNMIENEIRITQNACDAKKELLVDIVSDAFDENDMMLLRQKTGEVQEIGQRIDEIIRVNGDIEQQISRLGRCDDKLLAELQAQAQTEASLRNQIQVLLQELEKFPRKNRHSLEWYEKYHSKFSQLTSMTESADQTQAGIRSLLRQLDNQKQKALEESFIELNSNFQSIFSQIVPGGSAELKLVKQDAENESQKSHPSQFPDASQAMQLNSKMYKGIKVQVDFGVKIPDQGNEHIGLQHLSGGQKTVVVVALIFSVIKMEAAPFYILDEFDHALDSQYRRAIAVLIEQLSAKSQFLITTFKSDLIETLDKAKMFEVSFKNKKSGLEVIDQNRALAILKDQ